MNTSRSRQPQSGRSNLSARGAGAMSLASKESLGGSVIERLNDPIMVFRPFTPAARVMNAHKLRPPVLPKSDDIIQSPPLSDRGMRGRTKKSCPQEWEDNLQAPNFFETADFKTLLDDKVKEKFCRNFIERNKNRLWKFNSKYLNQTPRTVCADIVEDHEFIGAMRYYFIKEQTLNLGASDKVKACLKFDQQDSLGEIRSDNYLTSLTTSRQDRDARMRSLLAPIQQQHNKEHVRGVNHTAEYGNFSKYSGILQTNKGATLDR